MDLDFDLVGNLADVGLFKISNLKFVFHQLRVKVGFSRVSVPKFPADAATCYSLPALATENASDDAATHAAVEALAQNGSDDAATHAAVEALALASGQAWLNAYHADVQKVQQLKQHHVHILNEETGEREPLTHCRRADNPKLCKADFPRTL